MDDLEHLKSWIGRTEEAPDVAAPGPLAGLAALLDHQTPPWPEHALPPLAHWLYFLPKARQSEIGPDGHPRRGGFLPPVSLPRRMWAGSRIAFRAPIALGAVMLRRSTVRKVEAKSGAGGALVFVTVRHEISTEGVSAIVEEQDIVYREAPRANAETPKAPPSEPRQAEMVRTIVPDAVQLFRFSALTFNGHRIHYDRDYCRAVEFYPGLVVQGPYTATLLMDHVLRHHPAARIANATIRGMRPLFDGEPFQLCLAGNLAWARAPDGETAMTLHFDTK
jgi:3-methylfumaryl-CoA hydratase